MTELETQLMLALNLIVSDCLAGADPINRECRRITGSYDKAIAALAEYSRQLSQEQNTVPY